MLCSTFQPSVMGAVIEIVHAHRNGDPDGVKLWPASELSRAGRALAERLAGHVVDDLDRFMKVGESYLHKPIRPENDAVRTILAVGVGLLEMAELPAPMIVAPLVGQTEERGFLTYKGLVNAILRKVSHKLTEERQAHGEVKEPAAAQ